MKDAIRPQNGALVLHHRNTKWQARSHLGRGHYLAKSLKTENIDEAIIFSGDKEQTLGA